MLTQVKKSAAILSLNESNSWTATVTIYYGLELSNQKNACLDVKPVTITVDAKIILAKKVECVIEEKNSTIPEKECSFWRPFRLL